MHNRLKKWAKKLSGDNRKRLYDEQKEEMVKKEKIATDELVKIEQQVKTLIQGTPVYLQHFYMAFAKEIYSKSLSHKGQTFYDEVCILCQKWYHFGYT